MPLLCDAHWKQSSVVEFKTGSSHGSPRALGFGNGSPARNPCPQHAPLAFDDGTIFLPISEEQTLPNTDPDRELPDTRPDVPPALRGHDRSQDERGITAGRGTGEAQAGGLAAGI